MTMVVSLEQQRRIQILRGRLALVKHWLEDAERDDDRLLVAYWQTTAAVILGQLGDLELGVNET